MSWALQEIYVTHRDGASRRNSELDGVIKLLKEHTDDAWQYEILQNRSSSDESQLCAIVWNSSVIDHLDTVKIPVEHAIDGYNLWDRSPHAIKFKFRHKTDFVVVSAAHEVKLRWRHQSKEDPRERSKNAPGQTSGDPAAVGRAGRNTHWRHELPGQQRACAPRNHSGRIRRP